MAIEERPQSPDVNDDPATSAAREELRQTSISERSSALPTTEATEDGEDVRTEHSKNTLAGAQSIPTLAPSSDQDEEMRERLSSPKKKRGRDQDDDGTISKEDSGKDDEGVAGSGDADGTRPQGQEPQKKRVRDGSEDRQSDSAKADELETVASTKTVPASDTITKKDTPQDSATPEPANAVPRTSASAFASSGFASMANSSASPFGQVGASKPSVFGGSSSSTTSGFGALAASKSSVLGSATGTSGFGALGGKQSSSGFGFGGSSSSGFGGLGSGSAFGSALQNGFGGNSGSKLSSFAAPSGIEANSKSKPAKAFGAPDSDEEEDSDDDGVDEQVEPTEEERPSASPEEKKKSRSLKVQVEDGESGEATLLHIRAKLFALTSVAEGWKERGVGVLKINVPKECVAYDDTGRAIPGSFDNVPTSNSETGSANTSVPRLIMRQENTHRVILNTAITKQIILRDKPSSSAAQIYFTALEGDEDPKPINLLLKMSETNADLFRNEVASVQSAL